MKKLKRGIVSAAIWVVMTPLAHAAWQCPASLKNPLTQFDLYPGNPAELSNVIPDSNRRQPDGRYSSLWKLDPAEHLIAVCRYEGGDDKQIRLPPGLKECRAAGKPPSFQATCN